MPEVYQIQGPVRVRWHPVAGTAIGAFFNLGFTPRDGRPQIRREYLEQEVGSDEHGDEPGAIVHVGQRMHVEFVLAKWDPVQVTDLLERSKPGDVDALGEGESGVIGRTWWNFDGSQIPSYTGGTFSIAFDPVLGAGKHRFIFHVCRLAGEGYRELNMGNDGTQIFMVLQVYRRQTTAFPDLADEFYTRSII